MTNPVTTDPTDPTYGGESTDHDDRLQRRRRVIVALGAGTAAWALPSITTISRSAAATGSKATTPTPEPEGPTTSTTETPTTTTTEPPSTSTTTTAPSGLVLDHDLTHSYGTLPVWAGGFSAELWQEIAPTSSGVLSRIIVQGSGSGTPLTVNVHRIDFKNGASYPAGPSLGGASIPAPTPGTISHTFDLSVPVEAGTRYVLVFSAAVEGPSYGWQLRFGNPTSGLIVYHKHTGSVPPAIGSLVLQTYLIPS